MLTCIGRSSTHFLGGASTTLSWQIVSPAWNQLSNARHENSMRCMPRSPRRLVARNTIRAPVARPAESHPPLDSLNSRIQDPLVSMDARTYQVRSWRASPGLRPYAAARRLQERKHSQPRIFHNGDAIPLPLSLWLRIFDSVVRDGIGPPTRGFSGGSRQV